MQYFLVFFLSLSAVVVVVAMVPVSGFSTLCLPACYRASSSSAALRMVVTTNNANNNNDWESNPIPRKNEQKTTTTVPAPARRQVSWIERQTMDDVMIEPDYWLTAVVAFVGPLIIWAYATDGSPSFIGLQGGIFHILLAALLWVQTRRVRCVFEKDAFEFYNIKGLHLDLNRGAWLQQKPTNFVTGTRNRWRYNFINNYAYFPSKQFPVLCYFKETETPKERWNRWLAALDGYPNGQPHFFPGICNVQQFDEQIQLRGVKRKPIPKFRNQLR